MNNISRTGMPLAQNMAYIISSKFFLRLGDYFPPTFFPTFGSYIMSNQ